MLCDAPARKPRTHASHTAPPLPGRDHSRSPSTRVHMCPPRAPLTVVAHVSGPDRRLTALYETMFGSTSTCSSRTLQRYHLRVCQLPSWRPSFESRVQNHVRPPLLTATHCPDRGTAEPSCTPLRVPRAAQAPVHRMLRRKAVAKLCDWRHLGAFLTHRDTSGRELSMLQGGSN